MYHFIINATSSSGQGKNVWQKVQSVLEKESVKYEAHFPKSRRETELLAEQLTGRSDASECCHLVVLGGDGTLNAVLQGIVSFSHTKLSCIRTGSGNDFARNMRLKKNVTKALHALLYHPRETVLDYGELTALSDGASTPIQHRFLISCGIGYDADICQEANQSHLKLILNKLFLGKLIYLAIGIKQLFARNTTSAVLQLDNGESLHIPGMFFLVGMIHRYEGGGVPFCPQADAADGLLDVCLVRELPYWMRLPAVISVYLKKHTLFRPVSMHRCQQLTIKTQKPQWFHMDGETSCPICQLTLKCQQGLHFVQ